MCSSVCLSPVAAQNLGRLDEGYHRVEDTHYKALNISRFLVCVVLSNYQSIYAQRFIDMPVSVEYVCDRTAVAFLNRRHLYSPEFS